MVEFGKFQEGDEQECLDLWTQVFGASRDYFERYFWGDKHWKADYTRLCRVDGRIVSIVQIVRRMVRLNGEVIPMAGIANVATLPQYRGYGYSTQLLKDAHEVIDSEDSVFGLLFTSLHNFYGRLGWEVIPGGAWISAPSQSELPGWSFRIAHNEDLPQVMEWYAKFNAGHSCSVVRDEDYWLGWRRWNDPEWRSGTYIVERLGQALGYVWIVQHNLRDESGQITGVSSIQAREMGCDPEKKEVLRAMLGFAADTAYRLHAETTVINLPETGYGQVIGEVLPNCVYHVETRAMVRVGNRERLLKAYQRLQPDVRSEWIPEKPSTAVRLLFGHYGGSLEGADVRICSLFPPRPTIYWEGDGF